VSAQVKPKRIILCLTQIEHLDGVKTILSRAGHLRCHTELEELEAAQLIRSTNPYALYVNPNDMKFKLGQNVLKDSVRVIATSSTGLNHIDMDYCKEHKIDVISNTRDLVLLEQITSTAEHAFCLMLSLLRNVRKSAEDVHRYRWRCYDFLGRQVNRLTIGVVGYGRLGKMFARYANAFGAKVVVYDPYVQTIPNCYQRSDDLVGIFRNCDVVSLHVHVSPETTAMVNESILSQGDGVYLVNTSRGEIVDEDAIVGALQSGNLAGYGTDVLEDELGGDLTSSPIIGISISGEYNVLVTPHIAGATIDAQGLAYEATARKLSSYMREH